MSAIERDIRPLEPADQTWAAHLLRQRWGAERFVAHGILYYPSRLPGFTVIQNGHPAGLITYHLNDDECEIVTLDSLVEGSGIGCLLIEAVREAAVLAGCRRLWLITTNDNTAALHFYQKRGFRLAALYPNALERSRLLKPEIPLTGLDGIPLRDEIELEMPLP